MKGCPVYVDAFLPCCPGLVVVHETFEQWQTHVRALVRYNMERDERPREARPAFPFTDHTESYGKFGSMLLMSAMEGV